MLILKSIIFYISLVIWTVLMGIVCLPFLFLPSYLLKYPTKLWIRVIFVFLNLICNIKHKIEGLENIPNESVLIASKHQSAFETFALYYYLKDCFFVHKRELFFIPIFGQYLFKSNMVAINRDGGTKAMRDMLQKVQSKLSFGSSIIIFPEGTRKLRLVVNLIIKQVLLEFIIIQKEKSFLVALNSGLCWPKQSWVLKKGLITIKFLPTVDKGLDKKILLNEVQNRIETASNLLLDN